MIDRFATPELRDQCYFCVVCIIKDAIRIRIVSIKTSLVRAMSRSCLLKREFVCSREYSPFRDNTEPYQCTPRSRDCTALAPSHSSRSPSCIACFSSIAPLSGAITRSNTHRSAYSHAVLVDRKPCIDRLMRIVQVSRLDPGARKSTIRIRTARKDREGLAIVSGSGSIVLPQQMAIAQAKPDSIIRIILAERILKGLES